MWFLAGMLIQHIAVEANDCKRLNPEIWESIGVVATYGERMVAALHLLDVENDLSEVDLGPRNRK